MLNAFLKFTGEKVQDYDTWIATTQTYTQDTHEATKTHKLRGSKGEQGEEREKAQEKMEKNEREGEIRVEMCRRLAREKVGREAKTRGEGKEGDSRPRGAPTSPNVRSAAGRLVSEQVGRTFRGPG